MKMPRTHAILLLLVCLSLGFNLIIPFFDKRWTVSADTTTFGYTSAGATMLSYDSYNLFGSWFTTPAYADIEAVNITVYARTESGVSDLPLRCGIYEYDSSTDAGALVAETEEILITGQTWFTCDFSSPVPLSSSTEYFLVAETDYTSEGGGQFYGTAESEKGVSISYYGALPDPLEGEDAINYKVSIYAGITYTRTWQSVANKPTGTFGNTTIGASSALADVTQTLFSSNYTLAGTSPKLLTSLHAYVEATDNYVTMGIYNCTHSITSGCGDRIAYSEEKRITSPGWYQFNLTSSPTIQPGKYALVLLDSDDRGEKSGDVKVYYDAGSGKSYWAWYIGFDQGPSNMYWNGIIMDNGFMSWNYSMYADWENTSWNTFRNTASWLTKAGPGYSIFGNTSAWTTHAEGWNTFSNASSWGQQAQGYTTFYNYSYWHGTRNIWDDGWSHYSICTLTNPDNDYQLRINVTYNGAGADINCEGHVQTDFDDVRFIDYDLVTELSYWLEKKVDSSYAVFWVKLPSDATTDGKIYVFFGNPAATSNSNGINTFIYFQDFTGVTGTDPAGWTDAEAKWSIQSNYLYGGSGQIRNQMYYNGATYKNVRVFASIRCADTYGYPALMLRRQSGTLSRPCFWQSIRMNPSSGQYNYYWSGSGNTGVTSAAYSPFVNIWYTMEVKAYNNWFATSVNNVACVTSGSYAGYLNTTGYFGCTAWDTGKVSVDDFRIAKWSNITVGKSCSAAHSSYLIIEQGWNMFRSNQSWLPVSDGYNTFSNISAWGIIEQGWNTFGNTPVWTTIEGWNTFSNTSTYVLIDQGWNTFVNISSYILIEQGWNTFENSVAWSNVTTGWNTFGNTAVWQGPSGWNTFKNISSYVIIDQGWNRFGSEKSWMNVTDGWNTFNNIASWMIQHQGWNTFANQSSYVIIEQGWNRFGSTISWIQTQDGWNTFGNASTWNTRHEGWNSFQNGSWQTIEQGWNTFINYPVWNNITSGWNTFNNTVSWQNIDQGWNIFGNGVSFTPVDQGWNTFGNISSLVLIDQGYNTFGNTASWSTTNSGWNTFSNQVSYNTIDTGWNVFGNQSTLVLIDQGYNTFGNTSYLAILSLYPDNGSLICPMCYDPDSSDPNDTVMIFSVTIGQTNGTKMDITWTTWNGTILGELHNKGNGTWHITPTEDIMVYPYGSLFNYTVNVTDGASTVAKTISFGTDTEANCMQFTWNITQFGVILALVLFAMFFLFGYFNKKKSGGFFMHLSGWLLIFFCVSAGSYLPTFITWLLAIIAVYIMFMGLYKALYKKKPDEEDRQ